MTIQKPLDSAEREKALDPTASFIVQAPAGSGKTELLTQRYLKLLSLVNEPEEILAITFTRKAAAEMRNRIIKAITMASSSVRPEEPHLARTFDLAAGALDQDQKLGWNILRNPSRLKVRTIDSFCLYLTGRMPVLSGMGGEVQVMEDPDILYEEAARSTLLELNNNSGWKEPLARILLHLDNDWDKVKNLLMAMLKVREHWLRLITTSSPGLGLRDLLQGHLRREVERRMERTLELFNKYIPPEQLNTFFECASYAAENLPSDQPDPTIKSLAGMDQFPDAKISDLKKWLGIRHLLMTVKGSWRKKPDKRIGIPSPGSFVDKDAKKMAAQKKSELLELLAVFSKHLDLETSLASLDGLPDASYTDETWEILYALIQVLKMAVAQLSLVMQSFGRVDYPEISMAALDALGRPENPSDLLLRLDYQIKHILFDEFQDTSISQQEMLSRLTSGWTPDDGRTLFAVGDPMQSVYGFRDADVGVFLNARQNGIGDVFLKPLKLWVNFRSGPEVVNWVNKVFPGVFQNIEDHVSGSVIYSPMASSRETPGLVRIHPFINCGPETEAQRIAAVINETKADHPEDNIAVLVRSRTHLPEIIKILRQENISFQAVEIEPLKEKQVVMDLLSLTRVLVRPWDDLAWLCVLRAPWCGLDLKDLSRLCFSGNETCILEKLQNIDNINDLSSQGRQRLEKAAAVLVPAWENRLRRPLSRLVQGIWTALGGPACTGNTQEMEDALAFLDHLLKHEQNQTIEDLPGFEKTLQGLFSKPEPETGNPVQVMTIHKAKGLEFDTVILPGLDRIPPNQDKLLLQFMEVPAREKTGASARLLLAPISAYGEDPHPTYNFIEHLKKSKEEHETGRLIYVAATRAAKRLHLLGAAKSSNSAESRTLLSKPGKNSLLAPLWEHLEQEFEDAAATLQPEVNLSKGQEEPKSNQLSRLPLDWKRPEFKAHGFKAFKDQFAPEQVQESVPYYWAGDTIRHAGTCVHDLLARIADQGLEKWAITDIENMQGSIKTSLFRMGVSRHELDFAAGKVIQAVRHTLSDKTGRWILSRHHDAKCEYSLSALLDGEVIQAVIDRTFIDKQGVRWIIDYKTSSHEGGGLTDFLSREMARYQGQIHRYMRIFRNMEKRTVRAGLYFPLLKAWQEIRG
ncbi:MAG: UvrD-helicase domain-containing protein [Desulfonatronovibrio sp.]